MSWTACMLNDSSTFVYGARKRCSTTVLGMRRERSISRPIGQSRRM